MIERLPTAASVAEARPAAAATDAPSSPPTDRPRALVVDDYTSSATALSEHLESWGYDPRVAFSGEKALALLDDFTPDVVVTDLAMPGLSLTEIVSAAHDADGAPKVIAFGAHVQTELLEEARNAGCDDVMPRSKFSATLPEILRACLS